MTDNDSLQNFYKEVEKLLLTFQEKREKLFQAELSPEKLKAVEDKIKALEDAFVMFTEQQRLFQKLTNLPDEEFNKPPLENLDKQPVRNRRLLELSEKLLKDVNAINGEIVTIKNTARNKSKKKSDSQGLKKSMRRIKGHKGWERL